MSTLIGEVLGGRYRVIAVLGEGGMGTVYRAENLITGKQVAIKCMHPAITALPEASERLIREARAAARLSHPNVVDIYDVMQDGELLFLVMQLLQGETLGAYLLRNPLPNVPEIIALMLPAMAGVAAAHESGVVHRDLKPDNIFLERVAGVSHGVAKVLDFGVAKIASRPSTLTQTGTTLGTPLYMSLEQLRGEKDLDERADVYAFGVMLYEAITGRMPHNGENAADLAVKLVTARAAAVESLRPDIPKALARSVDRAVACEREQRHGTLRELMDELQPFTNPQKFRKRTSQAVVASLVARLESRPRMRKQASAHTDSLQAQEVAVPRAPRQKLLSLWSLAGAALACSLIGLAFFTPAPPPAAPSDDSLPATNQVHAAHGPAEGPHPQSAPGLEAPPEALTIPTEDVPFARSGEDALPLEGSESTPEKLPDTSAAAVQPAAVSSEAPQPDAPQKNPVPKTSSPNTPQPAKKSARERLGF